MITQYDVYFAAAILSKYYKAAQAKNKQEAVKELTQVMTAFNELYLIAEKNKEIEKDT